MRAIRLRFLALVALLVGGGIAAAVILVGGSDQHRSPLPRRQTQTVRAVPTPRPAITPARREALALRRLARLGLPVYCGGGRGRYVALTFDDGPGPYTHLAIRILHNAGARATFFLVGRNLDRFPGYLGAEAALGGLGDHTWTHAYLPALTPSKRQSEIADTKRAIEQASGKQVLLFRPPYGARNRSIDAKASSLGLLEIMWSIDSLDWKGANWKQIAANILATVRPGSIVLMHENRGQTIRALKYLLLPALRARHWKLVSIPELLALDPPTRQQLHNGLASCQHHPPTQPTRGNG